MKSSIPQVRDAIPIVPTLADLPPLNSPPPPQKQPPPPAAEAPPKKKPKQATGGRLKPPVLVISDEEDDDEDDVPIISFIKAKAATKRARQPSTSASEVEKQKKRDWKGKGKRKASTSPDEDEESDQELDRLGASVRKRRIEARPRASQFLKGGRNDRMSGDEDSNEHDAGFIVPDDDRKLGKKDKKKKNKVEVESVSKNGKGKKREVVVGKKKEKKKSKRRSRSNEELELEELDLEMSEYEKDVRPRVDLKKQRLADLRAAREVKNLTQPSSAREGSSTSGPRKLGGIKKAKPVHFNYAGAPEPSDSEDEDQSDSVESSESVNSDNFIEEDDAVEDEVVRKHRERVVEQAQGLEYHSKVFIKWVIAEIVCPRGNWLDPKRPDESEEFLPSYLKVERGLSDFLNTLSSSVWSTKFQKALDRSPELRITDLTGADRLGPCDVCQQGKHRKATKLATLSGPVYDRRSFMQPGRGHEDSDDEYDEEIGYSFNLGISCSDRAETYHAIKHWPIDQYKTIKAKIEDEKLLAPDPKGGKHQIYIHRKAEAERITVLLEFRRYIDARANSLNTRFAGAKRMFARAG